MKFRSITRRGFTQPLEDSLAQQRFQGDSFKGTEGKLLLNYYYTMTKTNKL